MLCACIYIYVCVCACFYCVFASMSIIVRWIELWCAFVDICISQCSIIIILVIQVVDGNKIVNILRTNLTLPTHQLVTNVMMISSGYTEKCLTCLSISDVTLVWTSVQPVCLSVMLLRCRPVSGLPACQ